MRRPYLMTQREKAVWELLKTKEKRRYWRYFITLQLGCIAFLVGLIWILNFDPTGDLQVYMGSLTAAGALAMFYSEVLYAGMLSDILRRRKQKDDFLGRSWD